MKSSIALLLILATFTLCFFGCKSNIPEEPATSNAVVHSYVNPFGETVAAPENIDPTEGGTTLPAQYVETINNVEIVFSSYYVYGNSVAEITNVVLDDDGFSVNAKGYADVKITAIGSRQDDMKIAYVAYDEAGEVVRRSHILADLKGVKEGDTVTERRLDFPREAVKIVFYNYIEPKN